jgi:UDP-glucose 4-epimerase
MKILVVGRAGYIGSTVPFLLQTSGHDVIVFNDLTNGQRGAVPPGAPFIVGSTGNAETLHQVFRENAIEAVMHFAAHRGHPNAYAD